jgi:peptidoglycan hydrolase-like protein with peptidoglycan-binding domain
VNLRRALAARGLLSCACCLLLSAPAWAQDPILDPQLDAGAASAEVLDEAGDPAAAGDLYLEPDEVKQIQLDLKDRGYFHGPADGRKGPRTRTALRNFQRDESLAVTGSLDQATLDRLRPAAPAGEAAEPVRPVYPTAKRKRDDPAPARVMRTAGDKVVGTVKTVGKAGVTVGKAGGETGEAVGKGGAVTGQAVGKAGSVTGSASATTAKAVAATSVTIARAPKTIYSRVRDVFGGGESRSDAQIQRSIEAQYAEDNRLVPAELDVRVADGNVTLALPDGARSDVPHAVRLAKLTPGVRSVSVIYTANPAPILAPPVVEETVEEAPDEPVILRRTTPAGESSVDPPQD